MDNINNTSGNNMPNNTSTPQVTPVSPASATGAPTGNNQGSHGTSSAGPIIGSIIVVLLIVLGGLYFYGANMSNKTGQEVPVVDVSANVDQATANLSKQGATDSLSEITNDLNATDLNGVDAELIDIDKALQVQ